MSKPLVRYEWLNKKSYQEIWAIQTEIHKDLIQKKLDKRALTSEVKVLKNQKHRFLLCEHHHVYTLGKSGSTENLLLTDQELLSNDIEFFKINRGGDITYHGPGQITGYPILDLDEFFTDIHKYVRLIEEMVIQYLHKWGLEGMRIDGYTGVWLPPNQKSSYYRKICAIGVHMSRWVSMHGFAFNVNTDISYFDKIIPCGIVDKDKKVTSLAIEIGRTLDINEVGNDLLSIFADLFKCDIIAHEQNR